MEIDYGTMSYLKKKKLLLVFTVYGKNKVNISLYKFNNLNNNNYYIVLSTLT